MSRPTTRLDPGFADLLRDALEAAVERQPKVTRRRVAILFGSVGLAALGGAGAAAAGLLNPPGSTVTTELAEPIESYGTGSETIDLGPAPDGSTGISFDFVCHDAGRFTFGLGGAAMTCSNEDVGAPTGRTWGNLPLAALEGTTFALGAPADADWNISLTYVNETVTEWSVNADGDTFGVINQHGQPDLVAVTATNGRSGYVRSDDLADADGTTAAESFTSPEDALEWQESMRGRTIEIPVYLSDGRTIVGVFVIEYPG